MGGNMIFRQEFMETLIRGKWRGFNVAEPPCKKCMKRFTKNIQMMTKILLDNVQIGFRLSPNKELIALTRSPKENNVVGTVFCE